MGQGLIRQNSKRLTYYATFSRQSLQSYLISKTVWFFGPPCIDNSVGSQSVTCLLELRLRCTVALYSGAVARFWKWGGQFLTPHFLASGGTKYCCYFTVYRPPVGK